jgi:PAS domain-containing protein
MHDPMAVESATAVVGVRGDGTVSAWTGLAELLFGWTPGEVVGTPLRSFLALDPSGAVELNASIAAGTAFWGWGRVRGKHRRVLVVARDQTERETALEELRRTRNALEAVLESSPLAVIAFDVEDRVTTGNSAAERCFGWRADEVLGELPPVVPPEKLDEFRANLASARAPDGDQLAARAREAKATAI